MNVVHPIPLSAEPCRADLYLARQLGLSRAQLKRAFEEGRVRLDGRRISKGAPITPGGELSLDLPDEGEGVCPQPELPLSVLCADEHLIFLDKPAGQPVYPLAAGELGTLANALVARFPECAQASPGAPLEGGLAHRLDGGTSGVMVAARSPALYDRLREAFSNRRVVKRYTALVGGMPGEGAEISLPIAHHPSNARKMIACADEADAERLKARPALTRYRVIRRLGDFALIDVEIPTGMRHQIRVHLAAVGAPVVGDALYGGPRVEGLERHFLHARRLELEHPVNGRRLAVEAPLPPELQLLLDRLASPA